MRRLACFLIALGLLTVPLRAVNWIVFEAVTTVGQNVAVLTASNINAGNGHPMATNATCRLEGTEVRYRLDGTAPTPTVGTLLEVGDTLVLSGNDILNNFKFIKTTAAAGTNATMDCHESSIS